MKKIYTSKLFLSVSLLIGLSSCKDLFNDPRIKSNPNAVSDVEVQTLLSGTLVGISELHEDTDVRISYMWAGQLTGLSRQHLGLAQYQVSSGTFDWGNLYPIAAQARLIQTKADALGDKWTKGVGQVAEALLIAKATAFWGDVPYSEAFDLVAYPTPVFDSQEEVYTELLATLDKAIENLSASSGLDFAGQDFIYGGDPGLWKKAAYSLKARLHLHLGDYAKAVENANLGISSVGEDALIPHGESQGIDQNLNYDFFVNNRPGDTGFDPPAFLPGFLKAHANAKTNETALYNHFFKVGITGTGALDPNTEDGFFKVDSRQPILSYFETQLILAEALARQNQLSDAVTALNNVREVLATGYINGNSIPGTYVTMGLKYENYVLSDFAPGGLANPVSSGRDQQSGLLYEIIAQKYIVMLAQYEVYNDVRRLAKATPVVQLNIQPIVTTPTGSLPQRYIYPQTEINTNPNVPKAGNGVADQYQTLPIFQ
ncbi:SusD/RagB family nutrient-binding outer membrane lipoprotein [Xanthocytophaga agilis]|uniref:SusD/RagB family nutrient-binding outer membrane lipoprotein n=1 Tax=Xanthocytophaga agilis TaxID=3048010 RepID=A0AAE3R3W4_9BACT|nr:SusD/RagB family nutrient-binding outer membrane lipoprotein [Xanthocytophaga agilis]MDJ1503264.1 SusD/RagB family nutrient-binding outer membrane lipoprotein [Xanthocytophaga agilis]